MASDAERVAFHPAARAEFDAAADFYEEQATGLGTDFIDEVEHAVDWVLRHPEAGTPVGGPIRRWLVRRFPFAILYQGDRQPLRVIAVMHLRRRPGYWRSRS